VGKEIDFSSIIVDISDINIYLSTKEICYGVRKLLVRAKEK